MIALFFLLNFAVPSYVMAQEQEEPHFVFRYEPQEGEARECKHKRVRDLPDWEVFCETAGGPRWFLAHVIVREHRRADGTAFELIYWVTERALNFAAPPVFHSTTAWVRTKGVSEAASLTLSQGVENDYANLTMDWRR